MEKVNRNYQVRRRQQVPQHARRPAWNWPLIGVTLGCVLVVLLVVGWAVARMLSQPEPVADQTTQVVKPVRQRFPVVSETGLSSAQRKVLALARQEYQRNPVGYDATVMKYTEGFRESWCADFISWVFEQAGTPFVHPDTDYWRIPGVQTLAAYYQKEDVYHEIGDGYVPNLGDVAFYFGETPDGDSAEHVAMILEVRGNTLVTIGGNEGDDSVLQVRYDKLQKDTKGLTAIGASGIAKVK